VTEQDIKKEVVALILDRLSIKK